MKRHPFILALFAVAVLMGCTGGRDADQDASQTTTAAAPVKEPAPTVPTIAAPPPGRRMDPGVPMGVSQDAASAEQHATTGTVTAIDAAQRRITLAHEAVSSLQWPPMTMSFQVDDAAMIEALQVGDQVRFSFTQRGDAFVIGDISKS